MLRDAALPTSGDINVALLFALRFALRALLADLEVKRIRKLDVTQLITIRRFYKLNPYTIVTLVAAITHASPIGVYMTVVQPPGEGVNFIEAARTPPAPQVIEMIPYKFQ